jgi:hypothetical protein
VQELFCKLFAKGRFFIYFSFEIGLLKNVHFKSKKSPPTQSVIFKDNDHQKFFGKKLSENF